MTTITHAGVIRGFLRRDTQEILPIEEASFELAWTEEDFCRCLKTAACSGLIAEVGGVGEERVVGYLFFRVEPDAVHILNLAVAPDARRRGIGRALLTTLRRRAWQLQRDIVAVIRERNLRAQLFFRACDYLSAGVTRNYYADTDEDAFLMAAAPGELAAPEGWAERVDLGK